MKREPHAPHLPAGVVDRLERLIFGHRMLILALFAAKSWIRRKDVLHGSQSDAE